MSELLSNTNTDFGPHFQLLHHCWKVIQSECDEGSPPYFNNKTTGETTWDHPPGDSVEEKCSFVVTDLCVSSGKICEFFIGRGIRVGFFWGFDGLGLVREIVSGSSDTGSVISRGGAGAIDLKKPLTMMMKNANTDTIKWQKQEL